MRSIFLSHRAGPASNNPTASSSWAVSTESRMNLPLLSAALETTRRPRFQSPAGTASKANSLPRKLGMPLAPWGGLGAVR